MKAAGRLPCGVEKKLSMMVAMAGMWVNVASSTMAGFYAALVEGRGLASLSYTRHATRLARTLLEVSPDYADAHLSTGVSEYIVGSLVAPLRWILRIGGYQGSKTRGLDELKLTAERGRLLGPFARILLSIAYLREHDTARARETLSGLDRQFPSNPLFARELRRIDATTR